jgi:hypothetical protein
MKNIAVDVQQAQETEGGGISPAVLPRPPIPRLGLIMVKTIGR